jgi:hypothetical protein
MADAMLSTRGKGSKQGSSSEGKGKSLKKNVCKDDRKVPSEEGLIERVIQDVEKSSGTAGSPFFLVSLSGPKTGVASSSRKKNILCQMSSPYYWIFRENRHP